MGALHTEPSVPTLQTDEQPLSAEELRKIDAYWRACNYCCVGCCTCARTRCCASR